MWVCMCVPVRVQDCGFGGRKGGRVGGGASRKGGRVSRWGVLTG